MTATFCDVDILETLDYDPAIQCDSTLVGYPGKHLFADTTAVWIVHTKPILPCGCTPRAQLSLTCDTCWLLAKRSLEMLANCDKCKALVGPPSAWMDYIETLKP